MRLRAAALTALAGAALVVPAAPAAAAACTRGTGVTVVVDFASLGGGTSTRCAPGDPSTGIAALRAAGFTPTRAAQEPGYFLCRIDGKPANDPCQRTSPADAYWSYWHAKPGGSWSYSTTGANDFDPAPGTVDGWAFGAGKPPSAPPPNATTPSSAPSASPATLRSPQPSTAPSRQQMAAAPPTPQLSPRVSRLPSPPPPSATPSADAASESPSASPHADDDVTFTHVHRVIPIPWGVLAAAVLVLLLVSAAVAQIVRQRREDVG